MAGSMTHHRSITEPPESARSQEVLAALIEAFRKALMEKHADDWTMETISEAAHICAHAWVDKVFAGTGQ